MKVYKLLLFVEGCPRQDPKSIGGLKLKGNGKVHRGAQEMLVPWDLG